MEASAHCFLASPFFWLSFFIVPSVLLLRNVEAQLSANFYQFTCPNVEKIVRNTLSGNLFTDPTAPAALTRLVFHDCQVQGCDASVMLSSGPGVIPEINAAANLGIRRLDFIDRIKAALERACPSTVSCADIIALAGRDALFLSGGPMVPILLGRRDGTTASAALAQQLLPPATISIDKFLSLFGGMGMTTEESIAIVGAHTIGIAHCANFANRLYPTRDPNLGLAFANTLRARCPVRSSSQIFVNLDSTNARFDTQYFKDVQLGRGLLTIDSELGIDPRTAPTVSLFGKNKNFFFQSFSSAFIKLTSNNVLTGTQGQIRTNCRTAN